MIVTHEDTPPAPLPLRRHANGDSDFVDVDSVFMFEMRRELVAELKALRRDNSEAMSEVRMRLGAIEANLVAGAATMEKHDSQLQELVTIASDLDRRMKTMESFRVGEMELRVKVLEGAEAKRDREDYARRIAGAPNALSRVVSNALLGAAYAGGGAMILALGGFLWWGFSLWVKAGAPGASSGHGP